MAQPNYFDDATFRVAPSSSAQQSAPRLAGGPRGSTQVNRSQAPAQLSTAQVDQQAAINQATFSAVAGLAQSVVEPYIEREQQKRFYEGARRQLEGEALADIVDDQPWYSKIFGPSASVQGARKMAQLRAVDEVVNGMAAEMPELRKLDGDQFQAELFKRADSVVTGDDQTDALIQMQILESSAPLIRAHTKEHYAYVQEEMQKEYTNASITSATALQTAAQEHARGLMSDDEWAQMKLKTSQSLMPLEGQNEQSYFQSVYASGVEAMQTGKWHYVKMLEDSGVLDAMPIEMRQRFRTTKRTAENQAQADLALGDYHLELSKLTAASQAGKISPNQVLEGVKRINAQVARSTGMDRPFLDARDVQSLITNNLNGIYRQQERAANAAAAANEKRQERAEQARLVNMAIGTGNIGNLVSAGVVSGTDAQAAATPIMQQQMAADDGRWQSLAVQSFNQSGFKFDYLQSEIQRGLRQSVGEDYNSAWQHSFDLYARLNESAGGQAAASAYAGDYAGQMQEAYEMIKAGSAPDVAYNRVFKAPQQVSLSETDAKAVNEAVANKVNDPYLFGLWSHNPLNQRSQQTIAEIAAPIMKQFSGTSLTKDEQLERAWPQVTQKADILGRFVARKNSSDQPLSARLRVSRQEAGKVFELALDRKAKSLGLDADSISNIQQQRSNGNTSYFIETYDDGEFNYFTIDDTELRQTLESNINELRNADAIESMWGDTVPLM